MVATETTRGARRRAWLARRRPTPRKREVVQPEGSDGSLAALLRANPWALDELTAAQAQALADWPYPLLARPEQLIPFGEPGWRTCVLLAGRRGGKSYALGGGVHSAVLEHGYRRILLAGATAADTRDGLVDVVLAQAPKNLVLDYEPSLRSITWPNGAVARIRSASEPRQFRGVTWDAHGPDLLGLDEFASWQPVRGEHAWDIVRLSMLDKAEQPPRILIATTPKPVRWLRDVLRRPSTIQRRWATRDNASNLDPDMLAELEEVYAGTMLGRQELEGVMLTDLPGALWTQKMLETARRADGYGRKEAERIVVAIDPALSTGDESDYTAIAVCGLRDGKGRVFEAVAGHWSPEEWARKAIARCKWYGASALIAERNAGGDMVEHTLRMAGGPPVRTIHASTGKAARAEPVALLYEQGKVSHAAGLDALEDQMAGFPVSADHDDLVDAVVYALTELMVERRVHSRVFV